MMAIFVRKATFVQAEFVLLGNLYVIVRLQVIARRKNALVQNVSEANASLPTTRLVVAKKENVTPTGFVLTGQNAAEASRLACASVPVKVATAVEMTRWLILVTSMQQKGN